MMRLTETDFGGARPIEGYGPGHWRVGGTAISGHVLVTGTGARAWGGYDDLPPLVVLAGEVDVLFIGTGAAIAHPPAPFRAALETAGLAIEAMDSAAAARTYNVLLSEGRRVAAALLVVGPAR